MVVAATKVDCVAAECPIDDPVVIANPGRAVDGGGAAKAGLDDAVCSGAAAAICSGGLAVTKIDPPA